MASDDAVGPYGVVPCLDPEHPPFIVTDRFGKIVDEYNEEEYANSLCGKLNAAYAAGRASLKADNERLREALARAHVHLCECDNGVGYRDPRCDVLLKEEGE